MKEVCKVCELELNYEELIKNIHGHGVCVCDNCAMKIANAYEHWHGGNERWGVTISSRSQGSEVCGKKRWEVFKRDGYACSFCGSDLDLTIDHIHPRSKGGSNDKSNLQTLCRSCNSSKGGRV